ncbi:hypothetical protein GCM10023208_05470 [Erythrobacter westpacificensis]|uniref:AbiJ N-terminal domain-containing protein n=1 Tax=Erythrobacter westpacificensis TaxID=1055231 RepID=A0ABP9K010_9SPHN
MRLESEQQKRILPLKAAIVENFDREKWLELGLMTGFMEEIRGHSRLLRSWDFGDPDYPGHVLDILVAMVTRDPGNLNIIEEYVLDSSAGVPFAQADGRKRISISPRVFDIPSETPQLDFVSVMMPFDASFNGVYTAIQAACRNSALTCQRADNIWNRSTVIQDVVDLIWRSSIVICDFSGRNANVFYECGIAHTLGRHVVPITQSKGDVPFDLQHHRYLQYHPNDEGLASLSRDLETRLRTLAGQIREEK